jgi:hypothetical protein
MRASGSPIDRLRELGGSLWLDGETVRCRIPRGNPESRDVVAYLRRNREAIAAMLRDQVSKAPTPDEIASSLPPGVELVSYNPKDSPFAVSPVSVVTDAGKFFRAYLADLSRRIAHPRTQSCAPLAEIMAKLASAGLELRITGDLAGSSDRRPR